MKETGIRPLKQGSCSIFCMATSMAEVPKHNSMPSSTDDLEETPRSQKSWKFL